MLLSRAHYACAIVRYIFGLSPYTGFPRRAPSASRRRSPDHRFLPTGVLSDPSGIQGIPHQIHPNTLPARAKGRDGSPFSLTPRLTTRRSRRDTAGRRNGGHSRHGRRRPIGMYVRAIHGNVPAAAPTRALVTVLAVLPPSLTAPNHRQSVPLNHLALLHPSPCHLHGTLPTHGQGLHYDGLRNAYDSA